MLGIYLSVNSPALGGDPDLILLLPSSVLSTAAIGTEVGTLSTTRGPRRPNNPTTATTTTSASIGATVVTLG